MAAKKAAKKTAADCKGQCDIEDTNYDEKDVVFFIDSLGRSCLGALNCECEDKFSVFAPTLINVQPVASAPGQMQLQLVPVLIPDLQGDQDARGLIKYSKSTSSIVEGVSPDAEITEQYRKSLRPVSLIQTPDSGIVAPDAIPQPPAQNLF